jgi:hypothetical protein
MMQYFISRANDPSSGKCQVNAVGTRSDLVLFVAGKYSQEHPDTSLYQEAGYQQGI